jgi:murein DD-endopeptidase MepM/ murein hydrolase activator NlpD
MARALPRAFAGLATAVYGVAGDWRGWRPLLSRTSAHLAVVVVAIVALGLSRLEWPARAAADAALPVFSVSAGEGALGAVAVADTALVSEESEVALAGNGLGSDVAVVRLPQPHTIIPIRPREGIITYTVQAGDTVQAIAAAFRLEPTTLMWANPEVEDAPDLLKIGQQIIVLPVDGVYHKVVEGETMRSIAGKYNVRPEAITRSEYNSLEPPDYRIAPGVFLVVPGGVKPYIPKVVTAYDGPVPEGAQGSGQFQWPVLGYISQGYWYGHRAIDIGAPTGSALLAADDGFVSFAGWTDVGYGYLVVIDHQNGYKSYYGHMSNIYVYEGQAVERGQVIGAVGSTGWSTGPHLHFEIRYRGVQQNPRAYLP